MVPYVEEQELFNAWTKLVNRACMLVEAFWSKWACGLVLSNWGLLFYLTILKQMGPDNITGVLWKMGPWASTINWGFIYLEEFNFIGDFYWTIWEVEKCSGCYTSTKVLKQSCWGQGRGEEGDRRSRGHPTDAGDMKRRWKGQGLGLVGKILAFKHAGTNSRDGN